MPPKKQDEKKPTVKDEPEEGEEKPTPEQRLADTVRDAKIAALKVCLLCCATCPASVHRQAVMCRPTCLVRANRVASCANTTSMYTDGALSSVRSHENSLLWHAALSSAAMRV